MGVFSDLMLQFEASTPGSTTFGSPSSYQSHPSSTSPLPISQLPRPGDFHQFKKFPLDIQLLIFEEAVQQAVQTPRIHEITSKANRSRKDGKNQLFTPPPLTHACHLSRKAAKKYYIATNFGGQLSHEIYFNPVRDVLYFPTSIHLAQFADIAVSPGHMDKIDNTLTHDRVFAEGKIYGEKPDPAGIQCVQRIAVGIEYRRATAFFFQAMARMKGLKGMTLVKKPDHSSPRYDHRCGPNLEWIDEDSYSSQEYAQSLIELFTDKGDIPLRDITFGDGTPTFPTLWVLREELEKGWKIPQIQYMPLEQVGQILCHWAYPRRGRRQHQCLTWLCAD